MVGTRNRATRAAAASPSLESTRYSDVGMDTVSGATSGRGGLTIPVLLNEAQKSGAGPGQVRYASVLWSRIDEDDRVGEASGEDAGQGEGIAEQELHELIVCLKWMVSLSERSMYQDRMVKFFGILASMATTRARIKCVDVLVNFLVEWSQAKEHLVRWRVCQLVANLVNNVPEEATEEIDSNTLDLIERSMMRLLLQDSKPHVRAAAARALLRFPQMDDETEDFDSCEVVKALVNTLNTDKSKEVRTAVLSVLPMSRFTLPYVVARTRDEADDVRRVALLLLAEKTSIEMCEGLDMRGVEMSQLLSKALRDRVPAVVEAGQALVTSWFDSCGGEPLTLLKALGVDGSEQASASELALHALFACERLNAIHVAMLASEERLGLRTDFHCENPNLMTPEEALFWRVVCVQLSSEASEHGLKAANAGGAVATVEAASAGERLEAFEAVMPSCLEEFAFIISLHRGQVRTCTQLLMLAAQCADFADASGRKCIGDVVHAILVDDGSNGLAGDGALEVAGEAGDLANHAAGVPTAATSELYTACFEVIAKLYSSEEGLQEAAAKTITAMLDRTDMLPLDGHRVHALGERQHKALLRIVAGYLALIKRVDMMDPSGLNDADAWTRLADGQVDATTEDAAEGTADDAKKNVPVSFSWQDIFSYIIYRSTTCASPGVRALSYQCMGLFSLVERDTMSCSMILRDMVKQLMTIDEDGEVKARIIQGLGDACLLRGPQAVEALLGSEGEDGAGCDGEHAVQQPSVVDVLVHYAQEWMDADDEAFRPCGEAVVESLIKLVAVNEFRRQSDEAHNRSTALEDADMIRIIVQLFVLCFHSCTVDSPKTRQSLLVFFQRYATMSVACQQYLATSLLVTARTAAALDEAMRRRTIASGAIAPQVIKFAVQLLQMRVLDRDGNRELFGHEPLAEIVMGEIISCGANPLVSKVYLNAVCKVPAALPTYDAGGETSETVARIHAYALHAAALFSSEDHANAVCLKEVENIKKTYRWPKEAGDVPDGEQLETMAAELLEGLEAFCADFPRPFVDGGNAGVVYSSEDEDFEAISSAPTEAAQRRLPARRARAKVANMGELSEDEEDRGDRRTATLAGGDQRSDDIDDIDETEERDDEESDIYDRDAENSAVNSPLPTPKLTGPRDRRRQSMASVAALGEALANQARVT